MIKTQQNYQIAIDGPAGAGKSTIAKVLAKKLGFIYIDSGAMYRACTLFLIKNNCLKKKENEIKKKIRDIKIEFIKRNKEQLVFLNGKNISKEIRLQDVTKNVSHIAAMKCIREEMVKRQKQYGKNGSIIMDGRDIGTAVFKDANLKIYLTASPEIRAKRRKLDLDRLKERSNIIDLIKDIQRRDHLDSSRSISPLSKAQDAVVIDSSYLNINEVIEKIESLLPA